ncbi:uncharacterized protein NPIL_495991 [Nephila pilipes]|uniref:Mutator-like transposase domain-containing protein n=1 Tax=Nephila pilipes TaxID=299642 RepID=A0A8X6P3L7_NEPPI|nr:uncharacterized protein NPIL_495991 [Nephila pilipes]
MRCIVKGAESAVMFCGIMNLPPPPTKFNNNLLQVARETCEDSMAEAVHEAVEENEGGRDIAVAVDGSWQKRGFSSKNGVVTVTSVDTGKVIDVEILSKHCICPNKTKHLQNCKRNFVGYSGKMESTLPYACPFINMFSHLFLLLSACLYACPFIVASTFPHDCPFLKVSKCPYSGLFISTLFYMLVHS